MEVSAADTVRIWQYVLEQMPAADRDLMMTDLARRDARGRGRLRPVLRAARPGRPRAPRHGGQAGLDVLLLRAVLPAHRRLGRPGPAVLSVAVLTRVPKAKGWDSARKESDGIVAAALAPLT